MLEVRPFSFRDRRFHELINRRRAVDHDAEALAGGVIARVHMEGEEALVDCVRRYDSENVTVETLRVHETEIAASRELVSEQFLTALSLARVNLRKFHEYQRRRGYLHDDGDGVRLSRQVRSLSRVGVCCGSSWSALLLCAVPAQVAGVGEIAVAAAPEANGEIDARLLATARVLGIDEVYRMSGAHAVAAFAHGAGQVERTDKIVGPGSGLTAVAKELVRDRVGVDPALGFGELVVVADDTANAKFIALDMLARAEHGAESGLIALLTTDRLLAEAVRIEMNRLADLAGDAARVRDTLSACGAIYVCQSLDAALAAANGLAPARLALMTRDNESCLAEVENAGTVLIGPWSMEAAADYFAGATPFLPLAGSSRFMSGLGVEDFTREITVVEYTPDRLIKTGRHIAIMAEADGSPGRASAVRERLELLKLTIE